MITSPMPSDNHHLRSSVEIQSQADVAQNPFTRVEFSFPVGWKILNWAGLIFICFFLIYVGNIGRMIVSYSDRGWGKAVSQTKPNQPRI